MGSHSAWASNQSASQQMSGQERARQMQEQEKSLQNQIEQPVIKSSVKENTSPKMSPEVPSEHRVLINSIHVTGVTIFSKDKIQAITGKYENKRLSLKEIQKIADLITDLYRKKGYVISRAYIPAQRMEHGDLKIMVIESKIGDILIKGNRFHSAQLIKSYLTIKKGDLFNYNDLKRDLEDINDRHDRNVKAVLVPGNKAGSTNVILNVKDSLPVHVDEGYNNFLSSLLRRNIYSSTFTENNLLGKDDILTFEYERGEANEYYSYTTRYLYPITNALDMGVYTSRSKEVMGGELADIGSRGKSRMYGLFGSQRLIKNDSVTSHFNFGFDYMDVYDFLGGMILSQDRLRVVKTGFDFDVNDDWGRTLINDDFNYGIPSIMGGTKAHLDPTDTSSSRAGAGGQFAKDTLDVMRLEKLPFDSTLLWKNQLQFSSSKLTSTEQYQIGGPANNRGYPISEFVGDQGYSMSWELSQPPYFVPKYLAIPFTHSYIYDDFRFIEFYDWSNVHLNSLQPGDVKNRTLRSAGCGAKLNVLRNLSASYEIAWPLAQRPSDGKGVYHWIEVTLSF